MAYLRTISPLCLIVVFTSWCWNTHTNLRCQSITGEVTLLEQRINIKIYPKFGKILTYYVKCYSRCTVVTHYTFALLCMFLNFSNGRKRVDFSNGRKRVENDPHIGRPISVCMTVMIEKRCDLVTSGHWLTIQLLTDKLNIDKQMTANFVARHRETEGFVFQCLSED